MESQTNDERWDTVERWMRRHGDSVVRTIYLLTYDFALSEELAQEVFIRAYEKLHLFRGNASEATWLYRIAVNLTRNRFRRRNREVAVEDGFFDRLPAWDRAASPEDALAEADRRRAVVAAVAELPPALREVVTMYYLNELSLDETAHTLRLPRGTVKSRLHRARERMRTALEGAV